MASPDQKDDLPTVWQLLKAYYQSVHSRYAFLASTMVIVMTLSIVAVDVAITYWFNYFYDALDNRAKQLVFKLIGVFCVIVTFHILLQVYRFYVSQMLGLRWRQWMTNEFVNRWMKKDSYYYLETFDEHTDNPDQRIQEDIGSLVTYSIELVTGFIGAIASFFAFVFVLWKLSGIIHINLGSMGVLNLPGYLVWVSVLYSLIGTYFAFKIGKPLIALNFEQQRKEATFRFAAIDLRSHAENVALYRGEEHQKHILNRLFGKVIHNWYLIIRRQKLLLWFTGGYNQVSVLLPLVAALPNYFAKVFSLGGFMQSLRAFGSIQESTSFFVNSYTTIAQWRAVGKRLTTFASHLDTIEKKVSIENKIIRTQHLQNTIRAIDVSILLPQGETLLTRINEEFIHGQHYLIKGTSGIGKSTFVRTIAGIWPFATGEMILPQGQKMMYLPQKTYMPIGTLIEAILFPNHTGAEDGVEEKIKKVLIDCHLAHFIPRLKETASWSEQFSPGELQRVAFARVLLHEPNWVFLDESTSMLDLANEDYLYRLLLTKLPNCSIVSVAHHPSLDEYHQNTINLTKYHILPETSEAIVG